MKKLVKMLIKLCLGVLISGAVFFVRTEVANASQELYFDENRNLVFTTYDKKASGGIKYKTIGWVLKRYEDTITAPGQNIVRFGNANCVYQMDDPNNSAYVYTAFVVYADTILNRIGQVSPEWKSQLVNYGGYVYLDAIMTVTVNGTQQGTIDAAGTMYGEVYETYEGIRNARGWADGSKLKAYYGLKVKYPYTPESGTMSLTDVSVKDGKYSSTVQGNFEIGGGTKEKQTYQVGLGIPSGEEVYITGTADGYRYDIEYQTVTGYASIPVQVVTNYELRWVDSQGSARSEIQQVVRLYKVQRNYEYIRIGKIKLYGLSSILFDSQCFADVTENINAKIPNYNLTHAASSNNHISVNGTTMCQVGTVVVNSSNCQRPSIPDENQKGLAENAVGELHVWSDNLKLGEATLLSNKKCPGKGMSWSTGVTIPQVNISIIGIQIPADTLNKTDYETIAKMTYQAADYTMYYQTSKNINKVTVHTPVIAEMACAGAKNQNESLFPAKQDIVIGEQAAVVFAGVGQHMDILGYGRRSYAGYVKKVYVKFPFSIYYKNKSYDANEWIEVGTTLATIKVPEFVQEGTYEATCMVAALNTPSYYLSPEQLAAVTEAEANLQIHNYAAKNTCEVKTIGKLYGFMVLCGEERYLAGSDVKLPEAVECKDTALPINIEKKNEKNLNVRIGVYANAIGDNADEFVDMDISYFVFEESEDGSYVRCPIDLYGAVDEGFTAETLTPFQEQLQITAEQARNVKDGVYYFEEALHIPDNIVAVPAGTDISDIDMMSDYILRDKQIVVHADVYGADSNGRKLSYENAQNAKYGYCNMWIYEGYNKAGCGNLPLEYGDILVLNMEGAMKNSGIVIGTH